MNTKIPANAKPPHPAIERMRQLTTDSVNYGGGWASNLTGLGSDKDKNRSIFFNQRRHGMDFQTLNALYRFDGIAKKIVDAVVNDSMKAGWTIKFSDQGKSNSTQNAQDTPSQSTDQTKQTTREDNLDDIDSGKELATKINEFNAKLSAWHKKVGLPRQLKKHLKQARAFGGALLILGIDDGQQPWTPLNPQSIQTFDWLKTLDRSQIGQSGRIEVDPRSPFFGFPTEYLLSSIFPSTSPNDIAGFGPDAAQFKTQGEQSLKPLNTNLLNTTNVHTTRVWRTDGVTLSDESRLANGGWGDSVLENSYEAVKNYGSTMQSIGTIIQDYTQGVYKIKGFAEIMAAQEENLLQRRFSLIDRVKSTVNAIILDSEGEEYERKTTSVNGLDKLITSIQIQCAAVSDMPLTKIFGLSPSGFGTGEGEGDNWDDVCADYQTDIIAPVLEYLYGLLFQTKEFSDVPSDWTIEFNPLQLEDPMESADIKLKTAQSDAIYLDRDTVSNEEIAQSRFGGADYSTETDLDQSFRRGMVELENAADEDADEFLAAAQGEVEPQELEPEAMGTAPENGEVAPSTAPETEQVSSPAAVGQAVAAGADVAKTALNGAQISSMVDLVQQVAAGEMPVESAVEVALFAFPTLSREQARGMFEPAAKLASEKPEPVEPPAPGFAPKPQTQNTPPEVDGNNAEMPGETDA